ncbi:hypothetical protein LNKW23_41020 [Paralimibaculum aggregatum]|uniref:Transposase n=1 Tax=Paralimibaculum aggregatum TaxID=3036245 RepID=A0ABQ6LNU3_9RHOB|nr:hypothetical protein LNKW23_41020 [Limibaculum sp. NKW23]
MTPFWRHGLSFAGGTWRGRVARLRWRDGEIVSRDGRIQRGRGRIGPGTGVRRYLACGATDMRKGIAGLAGLTQDMLRQQPSSGVVFAFRDRSDVRRKPLHCDGQCLCLYFKALERGRFPGPH